MLSLQWVKPVLTSYLWRTGMFETPWEHLQWVLTTTIFNFKFWEFHCQIRSFNLSLWKFVIYLSTIFIESLILFLHHIWTINIILSSTPHLEFGHSLMLCVFHVRKPGKLIHIFLSNWEMLLRLASDHIFTREEEICFKKNVQLLIHILL